MADIKTIGYSNTFQDVTLLESIAERKLLAATPC